MIKLKKQKGFSLVEMVLYVAILAFMLAIIMNMLVAVTRSVRRLHSLKSVQTSGQLSLERIVRETRNASSYVSASSTLNSSPGVLYLSGVDASSSPRSVEFYLTNGAIHVKENGIDQGSLTQSDAKVTSLIFRATSTMHSQAVKTEIIIESGTSTSYRTSHFYATAILRGSI